MRLFTSRAWGWLLVLVLMVAACGTEAQPATDADSAADSDVTTTTLEATTTTEAVLDEDLTLGDFFGFGGSDEDQQEQWRQQEVEIQESIRTCMAEQGFEYIPVSYPNDFIDFEFDEREWAETNGFGVTTWFLQEEEQFFPEDDFVDPNQENIEAMSDSERDAYYEALYGDYEEYEPTYDEDGNEIFEFEGFGSGCEPEAYEAVYGGQDDVYLEFGEELEALYEKVESDPRIVAIQDDWSACMADLGYTFSNQEEMYEYIFTDFQARADEVLGSQFNDPFAGWTEEEINEFFETKSDEEIEAFFVEAESATRSDVDEEALAALNEEEIALAVADIDCRGDSQDIYQEVYAEYEADFVRQNRTRLEEIRDADDS